MKKILISISLALMACVVGISLASCNDDNNDSHVHDIISVSAKDAICEEDGNIAYYKCSDCDEYFSDAKGENKITDKSSVIVKAKGHNLDKVEAKDANCSDSGNIEYYVCSSCDKYFSDKDGKNEIKDKSSVVIVANGHNLNKVDAKAEDCLNAGNIEYYVCDVCDKYFSDKDGKNEISAESVVILAKGHKGVLVPAVAADCENDGNIAYYKCENCNKLFSDEACKNEISADSVIVKAHHNLDKVEAVLASCDKDGNIEYYKCSVCNKYFSDKDGKNEIKDKSSVVIVSNGHNLNKVDAKAEDCLNPGNIEYYVCSVCDKYFSDKDGKNEISAESVVILAKGHKGVLVHAVAADCENDGNIAYYKCENCNKLFSDEACKKEISAESVVIPAKGHKGVLVHAVAADCENDGNIAYYKCENCNKLFSDEACENEISADSIVVKAHHNLNKVDAVEASSDKDGNIEYYVCVVCYKYFSDVDGKNEISLEDTSIHNYIIDKGVVANPTATAEGTLSVKCSNCDKVSQMSIPAITTENIEKGIYSLEENKYEYNGRQFVSVLKYRYNNDILLENNMFEITSSLISFSRVIGFNQESEAKTVKALGTYIIKNTSIDNIKSVILLSNIAAGYYKVSINMNGIDGDPDTEEDNLYNVLFKIALISSGGEIVILSASANTSEVMINISEAGNYALAFYELEKQLDISFTISPTIAPAMLTLNESLNIGKMDTLGQSLTIILDESIPEGKYKFRLLLSAQYSRHTNFKFVVNGKEYTTSIDMSQGIQKLGAIVTIEGLKGGDTINIVNENRESIDIDIMLSMEAVQ